MEFAVDLHIHSTLSPCGDEDMTPNNIVNMALLKGIDIVSVTDHNTALNLPAVSEAAIKNGIMLLPGIEVQTREEIHMLCYFKKVNTAVDFGSQIYNKLPDVKNNEEVFGRQLVMDSQDKVISTCERLLLSSAGISLKQLTDMVSEWGGVCIPAHVDRNSYSIISNLGFIPDNLSIRTVEISRSINEDSALKKFPLLRNFRMIKSSDAHYLWDISERENFISISELTLTNVLDYLRGE